MKDKIEVRCQRGAWGGSIEIAVFTDNGRVISAAKNIIMETMTEGERITPLLSIDMTTAQVLIDELWGCGLRPTDGTGSAGSLAATERHLADMRKIAFKFFEDEK